MFVHSSRLQKQFEYLSALGTDITPLYKQSGIEANELTDPDKKFDFEQYKTVLEFALRQTKNPHYGLDFGNQPQLGGTIGMMSASCSNLKEAFILGCKFLQLQGDFFELKYIEDNRYARLDYSLLESWITISPQTAKLEVDTMFSFLNTIVKINSNNLLKPAQINMVFQKPENTEKYKSVFGFVPKFGAERNEIVFDKSLLFIPMKAFNKETHKLLKAYLENQLVQLSHKETVTEKVNKILHSSFVYQFPDIEAVADKLNLSARTLQRKLSEEQTNFKEILQDVKFGIAKKLLEQNILTISEISYTLGYSDLGNFSRSFKKYTGNSPQEFRIKMNASG